MKITTAWNDFKKPKSVQTSKKSSQTSSLIYKEIGLPMERLPNKPNCYEGRNETISRQSKETSKMTLTNNQENKQSSKKISSFNSIKKKNNTNLSNYQNSHFYHKLNAQHSEANSENSSHTKVFKKLEDKPILNNNFFYHEEAISSLSTLKNESEMMNKKMSMTIRSKQEGKMHHQKLQKKMFCYNYIIGKGGFGKVWKVEHIKTRNQYAMKEMLKAIVMTKKSVQSIINEKILLASIHSPFLVNMHFAFQDRDTLYLVLDLMEGGDLRYHLGNKTFSETQAKFFIACIILALEDLHKNQIIHRDIKPQNLVLDSRGYIRITDLGIARIYRLNNSSDTSGTPGYMSPQVICRNNHSFVSDFFAIGVVAYQLMMGKRPYNGNSRNQIRDSMLAKQVQVRQMEVPQEWSNEAADFINKLIQRKPENRLGYCSIEELKSHPWLRYINWEKLYNKEIESPFIPMMKKANFDQDQQITIEDEQEAQLIEKNSLLLRKTEFQDLFNSYYYHKHDQLNNPKIQNKIDSILISPNISGSILMKKSNGDKQPVFQFLKPAKQVGIQLTKNMEAMETLTKDRRKRSSQYEKPFFK